MTAYYFRFELIILLFFVKISLVTMRGTIVSETQKFQGIKCGIINSQRNITY